MPWNVDESSLNPNADVFGYGHADVGIESKNLQSISLPICAPSELNLKKLGLDKDKIITTAHPDGISGPMVGDSGGPLMTTTANGKPVLLGIACRRAGTKTDMQHFYIKVAEYKDWIKEVELQVPRILQKSKVHTSGVGKKA